MNLNNSTNRQGSNLHESEASEVAGLQNVYPALVPEENVLFVEQCMPVDGPEPVSESVLIQSLAIIGIVDMVIIDRSQPHQENRPALERPRSLSTAKNLCGL